MSIPLIRIAAVLFAASSFAATTADAQIFYDENPSLPTGVAMGDLGGFSVAIDGDTMVTGCVQLGTGPGLARVFVRTAVGAPWSHQIDLTVTGSLEFGRTAGISGDTLVIGAPAETVGGLSTAGAVYVFQRTGTTWGPPTRLLPSIIGPGYGFGGSLAIRGTTLLIGATRTNQPGIVGAGAVFVFELAAGTWSEKAVLVSGTPVVNAMFGGGITFDGESFAAAAPVDDGVVTDSGAVYVFRRTTPGDNTTWMQEAKLIAPAGAAKDEFGSGTSLQGDRLCIGAHQRDIGGLVDAGEAHIFERSGTTWSHVATLTPCVAQAGAHFGVEVALNGDLAAVGAHVEDNPLPAGPDSGAVRIFQTESSPTWIQSAKVQPAATSPGDRLGSSIVIQDRTMLVGATRYGGAAGTPTQVGAAYDFTLLEPSFLPYGSGCWCDAFIIPELSMSADPLCGGGAVITMTVKKSVGPTTGLVFLGSKAPFPLPTGNGCSLLVAPAPISFVIPIPGFGPGTGQVSISAPISPVTSSFEVALQVFINTPTVYLKHCATNAVLFRVQ